MHLVCGTLGFVPARWTVGFWGLVTRNIVILACAGIDLTRPGGRVTLTLAVALLLAAVAVIGSIPAANLGWRQPVSETLAASVIVTTLAPAGEASMPYLLLPIAFAGVLSGIRTALACLGVAAAVLVGMSLLDLATVTGDPSAPALIRTMWWLPLLAATAVLSGWANRLTKVSDPVVEPAYTDAHRLLSELNLVARHLSLGLDPHTLATALVEDLQGIAVGTRATVLVRSAAGRFVPVVGEAPNPLTESAVLDAWVSAGLVRRGRSGITVVALPVLMGQRVVAVVVLADSTGSRSLRDESVKACTTVIAQAGPRLASALLFDDVRRLATVDERHRLAREIHDGIAQDMASVGYQIDDIASDAPAGVGRRLQDLREHLTTLVTELRLSIFDLRTAVDESVGLSRTLSDYVQRVSKQAGLVVHVSADESPHHRLPLATEIELLRIVQEAVTNVRRHAFANNLWLTVVVNPPHAHVVVTDDGRGLGSPRPDSMGITGMRERAQRIGAELSVRNREDGNGTVVELVLATDGLDPEKVVHSNRTVASTRPGVTVTNSPTGRSGPGTAWKETS